MPAAILWTLAILAACSIPGSDLPDPGIPSLDKAVHLGVFFGFGVLWMRALDGRVRRCAGWVLASGLAYGVFTEFWQGWLPFDRSPDPADALANAVGVMLGVLAYRFWHGRTTRRA
ncbi:MAG: VanZ family protein [Rhodothermales bacterium]|nr:VanZ family protein [Rhodothermales bacterium]